MVRKKRLWSIILTLTLIFSLFGIMPQRSYAAAKGASLSYDKSVTDGKTMQVKIKNLKKGQYALISVTGNAKKGITIKNASKKVTAKTKISGTGKETVLKVSNKGVAGKKYKLVLNTYNSKGKLIYKYTTQNISVKKASSKTAYKDVVVSDKASLESALATVKSGRITLETSARTNITIGKGKYPSIDLVIDAPNADITNKAQLKSIQIDAIAKDTWTEMAIGNSITIDANAGRVVVPEGIKLDKLTIRRADSKFNLEVRGKVNDIIIEDSTEISMNVSGTVSKIHIKDTAKITMAGNSKDNVSIDVGKNADGTTINTSVPVKLATASKIEANLDRGAQGSSVKIKDANANIEVTNDTGALVTVTGTSGKTKDIVAGDSLIVGADGEATQGNPVMTLYNDKGEVIGRPSGASASGNTSITAQGNSAGTTAANNSNDTKNTSVNNNTSSSDANSNNSNVVSFIVNNPASGSSVATTGSSIASADSKSDKTGGNTGSTVKEDSKTGSGSSSSTKEDTKPSGGSTGSTTTEDDKPSGGSTGSTTTEGDKPSGGSTHANTTIVTSFKKIEAISVGTYGSELKTVEEVKKMLPATVAGITEYGEIEFKVKSWTESITYDNLFGIGYKYSENAKPGFYNFVAELGEADKPYTKINTDAVASVKVYVEDAKNISAKIDRYQTNHPLWGSTLNVDKMYTTKDKILVEMSYIGGKDGLFGLSGYFYDKYGDFVEYVIEGEIVHMDFSENRYVKSGNKVYYSFDVPKYFLKKGLEKYYLFIVADQGGNFYEDYEIVTDKLTPESTLSINHGVMDSSGNVEEKEDTYSTLVKIKYSGKNRILQGQAFVLYYRHNTLLYIDTLKLDGLIKDDTFVEASNYTLPASDATAPDSAELIINYACAENPKTFNGTNGEVTYDYDTYTNRIEYVDSVTDGDMVRYEFKAHGNGILKLEFDAEYYDENDSFITSKKLTHTVVPDQNFYIKTELPKNSAGELVEFNRFKFNVTFLHEKYNPGKLFRLTQETGGVLNVYIDETLKDGNDSKGNYVSTKASFSNGTTAPIEEGEAYILFKKGTDVIDYIPVSLVGLLGQDHTAKKEYKCYYKAEDKKPDSAEVVVKYAYVKGNYTQDTYTNAGPMVDIKYSDTITDPRNIHNALSASMPTEKDDSLIYEMHYNGKYNSDMHEWSAFDLSVLFYDEEGKYIAASKVGWVYVVNDQTFYIKAPIPKFQNNTSRKYKYAKIYVEEARSQEPASEEPTHPDLTVSEPSELKKDDKGYYTEISFTNDDMYETVFNALIIFEDTDGEVIMTKCIGPQRTDEGLKRGEERTYKVYYDPVNTTKMPKTILMRYIA